MAEEATANCELVPRIVAGLRKDRLNLSEALQNDAGFFLSNKKKT